MSLKLQKGSTMNKNEKNTDTLYTQKITKRNP